MMRSLCFTAIFLYLIPGFLFAQDEEEFDSIADNVLFRKEMSASIIIHSNGWGLEYRIGQNKSVFNKWMFEANLLEMKDAKEIKSINPFFTNTKSYIYGKLNTLYIARAGMGQQYQLNRKPYFGGVELRLFYSGGISVAMAKPVYLYIIKTDGTSFRYYTVTEKYDPDSHFPDNIFGRASFTKGFDKIKPYPGAYAKAGLSIEFGTINQKPKIVEVGAALDVFAKPVPVMAFKKADQFFLTLYLSVGIGKRYN